MSGVSLGGVEFDVDCEKIPGSFKKTVSDAEVVVLGEKMRAGEFKRLQILQIVSVCCLLFICLAVFFERLSGVCDSCLTGSKPSWRRRRLRFGRRATVQRKHRGAVARECFCFPRLLICFALRSSFFSWE